MRILQVSDCYPPAIGGTERHVQSLSSELARRGHEVMVATLSDLQSATDGSVQLRQIHGWSRVLAPFRDEPTRPLHPPLPDPGVARALVALVDEFRPDVMHAHGWIVYSCLAVRARRRVPLVVTLHDYGLYCANKCLLRYGQPCSGPGPRKCLDCARAHYGTGKGAALAAGLLASQPLHARADRLIAISRSVASRSTASVRGVPMDVIPSFVPDEVADSTVPRSRPSFAPPGDYVMFAGRLGPEKGIDVLLRAFELWTGARLLLIGAGSAAWPRPLPQGAVLVRNLDHANVMSAWSHATVAVVPSVWEEPFGQVAIEAMSAGTPVVASRVGGLAEIIDDESGVLVPPSDPAALAGAVERLLGDETLRAEIAEAGRRRARAFTVAAIAGRVEAIFQELCDPACAEMPRPVLQGT